MPDLEAVTEEIRAAGDSAHQVAEGVRPIDVTAVSEAAGGMPGAKATGLFSQLEKHLAANLTKVADGFGSIGDAMHQAAELYESNEQAAVDSIGMPYSPEPGI